MAYAKIPFIKKVCCLFLLCTFSLFAEERQFPLNIHVHYQQASDTWKVQYELPIAVDHIAFSRRGNFDRTKHYHFDESLFTWDKADDVVLIKSIDGSTFTSLDLTFSSDYSFIIKDYTHNLKYTDGSVLLYTNHLALGANVIEDKLVSPIGRSFDTTTFHFYSLGQHITFLGKRYKNKAQWESKGGSTYIYFGNIPPIENDNMIAIVDPALPKWAWDATQQNFPKLFDYYKAKTGQALNFKPVVFFNYDQVDGDYSNYSGGTLDGLVQLTINGKHWQLEDKAQFNKLFHFLAHESAHFWNGQMFAFEDQKHSWMHEGGADTFANFAMMEFGLINYEQMVQKFEDAANHCILNKDGESLELSVSSGRYRNYYTCGAAMGFASHLAVKSNNANQSVFDVWKHIFHANIGDKNYNQQSYFNALNALIGSEKLSQLFHTFSHQTNLDNALAVMSWFDATELNISFSQDHGSTVIRHWGERIIKEVMWMYCHSKAGFNYYDDYIHTQAMNSCEPFSERVEIQYMEGIDILKNGIEAYTLFRQKCENKEKVSFQNRAKTHVLELQCLKSVPVIKPRLNFNIQP